MSRSYRYVHNLLIAFLALGLCSHLLSVKTVQGAAPPEIEHSSAQATECSLETISGTYLFHGEGVLLGDDGPMPYAEAGIWTLDGTGNALGVYSGSLNGESIASADSFDATYDLVSSQGSNGCSFMILAPLGDEENAQIDLFTTTSGEMATYFSSGFSGTMWRQMDTAQDQVSIEEEPRAVDEVESLTVEMEFVNFLDFGNAEQDVFIASDDDTNGVMRVNMDDVAVADNLTKEVYSSATEIARDHENTGQMGPFPMGEALGFTLEEWLAASASGTYTLNGSEATISVTFENLIPNGVYSAWCGRLSFTPTIAVLDAPCGAIDGSQSVFHADAEGNAVFELTMHPLTASNDDYFADLAFAYHSDGQTHGTSPGEF